MRRVQSVLILSLCSFDALFDCNLLNKMRCLEQMSVRLDDQWQWQVLLATRGARDAQTYGHTKTPQNTSSHTLSPLQKVNW